MMKILVIEDEAILRDEVVDWLTFEGYDARGAEDGVVGVDYAIRMVPDLIICDITMPRLDGYGVLSEVHSNPATASVPFVFVTARASHEDVRRGMSLGADDYITKPFTLAELLQAVGTRLQKKAAQEQQHEREVNQLQMALMQEQEQRLLKTKLVAMFSHDFRNPLTSIRLSNGLLRDYADRMDDKRRLSLFNRVDASISQLLQMLDDMLLVAQMETGHLDFTPEVLNAQQFFQHSVDEFQAIDGETHSIVFDSRFTGLMTADPRLLRQIAANLIANAIKYSPKGSEVRVTLDQQDGQCILTVQDQGIGIPEADQERLFGAFQRGSNVGNVSGTGLGLAIVKQAVDLHGGTIHLESQAGVGTTAIVTIPIRQ